MRKDVAVVLYIWAKTVSCLCSVCICNACKSIRKSKLINLLRCTNVYVCKSWVVPSQWLCECRILVAAYAQRRCCCSVYMSKDCVMFLQCMWLRCMYIDLIKRKIDRFTASHECVDMQKLNRVFAVCMYVMYMSCSICAKTLLSFCIYEQRLCCVFAMYVIAIHVNRSDNAKNRLIYCILQACKCAKAESCLRNVCVCDVYELQRVRKDVAVVLCIWAKTVSCLCSVCICNACKSIRKSKSIDLLRCINMYMCKSWVVPLQCMCVWCIWVAAYAQRRCCCSVYMSKDCVMSSQCMWLQCMYIDLIKRKIDQFTALCKHVNAQKLNHVFAVYVCILYMSSTCE